MTLYQVQSPVLAGALRVLSSPPQGFCGSITTGYCATYELNNYGPPVTVATAIAISGAGLSPNSGTETNLCLDYLTVGDIDYGSGEMGQLTYVKSSLTGDEPATILEYHASHPASPQESSRNQFFTEGQVETYRALGMHIATGLLDSIRTFPWAVPASAPHEHATYADVAPAPGVPR